MLNFEYDAELEKKVLLEEGREEVAIQFLRDGFDVSIVAKNTGLSLETVRRLADRL